MSRRHGSHVSANFSFRGFWLSLLLSNTRFPAHLSVWHPSSQYRASSLITQRTTPVTDDCHALLGEGSGENWKLDSKLWIPSTSVGFQGMSRDHWSHSLWASSGFTCFFLLCALDRGPVQSAARQSVPRHRGRKRTSISHSQQTQVFLCNLCFVLWIPLKVHLDRWRLFFMGLLESRAAPSSLCLPFPLSSSGEHLQVFLLC